MRSGSGGIRQSLRLTPRHRHRGVTGWQLARWILSTRETRDQMGKGKVKYLWGPNVKRRGLPTLAAAAATGVGRSAAFEEAPSDAARRSTVRRGCWQTGKIGAVEADASVAAAGRGESATWGNEFCSLSTNPAMPCAHADAHASQRPELVTLD